MYPFFWNWKLELLTTSIDELTPGALTHKEKRHKSNRQRVDAMDLEVNVNNHGKIKKKRKLDDVEGGDDVLSKQERKRLRKLAKEEARAEDVRAPKLEQDDSVAVRAKREKKEKKRERKDQVCLCTVPSSPFIVLYDHDLYAEKPKGCYPRRCR